jgi:alcohol dehydrogenase class IV
MLELRKFVAPEFVFGPDASSLIGRYLTNFGAERVLIVTDPGIIAVGWVEKISELINKEGIDHFIFSSISANPRSAEVMTGAEFYHENQCDIIVAIGGGSPMDCAKGIGIVTSNHQHILSFEGIDNVPVPGPPLICIPTTAGTSADVSQFSIITNEREEVKIAIVSKTTIPDAALIDSKTTMSMPPYLTACTGMDALVHAIEAYVSTANSPIYDLHALEAIRLLSTNLLPVMNDPDNIELRNNVMLGSLQAGLAFSNASLGAVHAMAHSLGGFLDLPHGECNAILLEHVIAFNFPAENDRYMHMGKALNLDLKGMKPQEIKKSIVAEIDRLKRSVGIQKSLGELGIKRTDIPTLAQKALKDPCMVTNPRVPTQRDIEVIYEEAL